MDSSETPVNFFARKNKKRTQRFRFCVRQSIKGASLTQNGHHHAPDDLVPLTRQRKKGGTYFRRPKLEEEVRAAAQRPLLELVSGGPRVSNSCLLYFVRNFIPNGPSSIRDAIVTEFLSRIDRQVIGGTRGVPAHRRTEIRTDVRDWFLEQIYARSDRLDVYEFAFNLALKARVIDTLRKYETRDTTEIGEGSFEDDDGDSQGTIDAISQRQQVPRPPPAEVMLELKEVLAVLSKNERKVLIATEYYGLGQKEVGQLVGVGSRRIRQILADAKEKIEAFKKGDE